MLSSLFIGCAKHNSFFLKQGYHDVTSHYNSYFNSNEKYNLAIKALEETRKENFDEIIPVYAYGTLKDTKTKEADFDVVIDKSSESIQLHQFSNWADDNFLLLGKAFFMKGKYDKALESLRYITANYKDGVDGRSDKKIKKDKNNKKKKARAKKIAKKNLEKIKDGIDIRPKKNLFIHESSKSIALIWMANTFTAKEQYTEATAVLDYISTDKSFIQNYEKEVELAHANYFINQNQYHEAISHLENAVSMFKSRKRKVRLYFILAQLFEKTGNKSDALKNYKESIKGNPNYDMVFNAKLNSLKLSNGSNSEKEDKLLAKLIKDSKNSEQLDQLYYERALIALKNKDEDQAKVLLNKSVEVSIENKIQKAKSHLLLAELFYDKEDYTPAQENYAACLTLIDTDFEKYLTIEKRANVLTNLVVQLDVINKNDSLLKISNLPLADIEALVHQQAEDIIDAEISAQNSSEIIDQFAANDKLKKDSKWYFYSENAKKIGYAKFIQTWGTRKLEDDWRRENKSNSNDFAEEPKTEEELYDEKVEALYIQLLSEIPQNDSSKTQFKDELISAHYDAANIYKFDLKNDPNAIHHFKTLAVSFENSEFDAESLFNLYLLYDKAKKTKASNKNKNLVLSKYPKSKFAKLIKEPNFADKSDSKKNAVEKYYEDTYLKFVSEDFSTVITRISKSKTLYPSNKYEAKFALLEAVTIGKQKKYQPYVNSLEHVIATYKNTEEEEKASELLAYLKGETPKAKTSTISTSTKEGNEKDEKGSSDSLFDPNKGKDKEGFKLNFGKKELLNVGASKTPENKKGESVSPKKPVSSPTTNKKP